MSMHGDIFSQLEAGERIPFGPLTRADFRYLGKSYDDPFQLGTQAVARQRGVEPGDYYRVLVHELLDGSPEATREFGALAISEAVAPDREILLSLTPSKLFRQPGVELSSDLIQPLGRELDDPFDKMYRHEDGHDSLPLEGGLPLYRYRDGSDNEGFYPR